MTDPAEGSSGPGRAVVVMGAPRSGVSVMARLLQALGVGTPDPPATGSIGRYEDEIRPISDLNESMLTALGGSWRAPPDGPTGAGHHQALAVLVDEARRRLPPPSGRPAWMAADPRFSLLLPVWQRQILRTPPLVVFVYRDPASAAGSLVRREQMSVPWALALWEHYVRAAVDLMAGLPVALCPHRRLVADPVEVAEMMRDALFDADVPVGEEPVSHAVLEEIVEASRPRGREGVARHATGCSSAQLSLADLLDTLGHFYVRFPRLDLGPATPWARPLLTARRFAEVEGSVAS